ncbi:MAG: hypothetical protein IT182_17815 [Acidobacteria bacterium]|nr:hypothetical protein [Acidobacteriota bacterium]
MISVSYPYESQPLQALGIDAWRRAEAMGLLEPAADERETLDIPRLIDVVRDAGIARNPALHFDNVDALTPEELASVLRLLIAALEASPVPDREWPALLRVIDGDQLAALLGISASSLRRYAARERTTPDLVAARLHHLALIVGDLAGAYNDVGIRRWFERKRTALDGLAPSALLSGDWDPDDEAPQKVRLLARALVSLGGT